MLNMMQFQFRRLFRKSSLYICLLITTVFSFYAAGTVFSSIESTLKYAEDRDYLAEYNISYSNKEILSLCFAMSFVTLVTAIFTAIFVCEDRSHGTIKTIYSKGYSRTSVFVSKYIATVVYITMYFAAILLVAFASTCLIELMYSRTLPGIIVWNNENIIPMILNQYLSLIAVNTLYYLVSELVGKTGIAIALSIFAPIILLLVLGQIYMIVRQFSGTALDEIASTFTLYYLPTIMGNMLTAIGLGDSNFNYLTAILFDFGYIIVFGSLALLVTNKKQVMN